MKTHGQKAFEHCSGLALAPCCPVYSGLKFKLQLLSLSDGSRLIRLFPCHKAELQLPFHTVQKLQPMTKIGNGRCCFSFSARLYAVPLGVKISAGSQASNCASRIGPEPSTKSTSSWKLSAQRVPLTQTRNCGMCRPLVTKSAWLIP